MDVKSKAERKSYSSPGAGFFSATDMAAALGDAFDYIDILETERVTRDLAIAEAVRDAYVHLIRNVADDRSESYADYFATINLAAVIAGVKP